MSDATKASSDNPVIRFERPKDALHNMKAFTKQGIRTLDIFSHTLHPALYDDSDLQACIIDLIKYSPRTKVRILIRNSKHLYGRSTPLLTLAQRIPSKFNIRLYQEGARDPDMGFFCIDRKHLIFFNNEQSFQGFARRNAKPESRTILDEFEHIWVYGSKEDPNLRRLCI